MRFRSLTLFSRSDGERRRGVHAGQQQTRRQLRDAVRPDDAERLLHRPVAGGRAEVLIRDPSSRTQEGGSTRVGVGGGRFWEKTQTSAMGHAPPPSYCTHTPTLTPFTPDTQWAWPMPACATLLLRGPRSRFSSVISVVRNRLSETSASAPRTLQKAKKTKQNTRAKL